MAKSNNAKLLSREQVFEVLRQRGAAEAHVEFSGGGDEGDIDRIALLGSDGEEITELKEWEPGILRYDAESKKWEVSKNPTPDDLLAHALSRPVYDQYGGFAGDFTVVGEVIWDVANESVRIDGSEAGWESIGEEI